MKTFTIKTPDREIGLGDGVYKYGNEIMKIIGGNVHKILLIGGFASYMLNSAYTTLPADFNVANESDWDEAVANLMATLQLSREGDLVSNCCGAKLVPETDICSDPKCGEHCKPIKEGEEE